MEDGSGVESKGDAGFVDDSSKMDEQYSSFSTLTTEGAEADSARESECKTKTNNAGGSVGALDHVLRKTFKISTMILPMERQKLELRLKARWNCARTPARVLLPEKKS